MRRAAWRNRVQAWHCGKLIILWTWGGLLIGLAYFFLVDLELDDNTDLTVGFAAVAALLIIPVILSAITWVWLGGKEGPTVLGVAKGEDHSGNGPESE